MRLEVPTENLEDETKYFFRSIVAFAPRYVINSSSHEQSTADGQIDRRGC